MSISYLFLPLCMASSGLNQVWGLRREELLLGWGRNLLSPCFLLMVSPRLDQIARKIMGVGWVGKPKICT